MHLFKRVEGNLSFFFYLFFPVEKKKDILFWSLSFFQPNFITSLTMVHLSLELHTSGLKLTQNTCTGHVNRAISSYAQPPLAPHRPPIKTIIVVHRQHPRHLPLRRRCLYCPRYFKQQSSNGATWPLVQGTLSSLVPSQRNGVGSGENEK